MTNTITDKDADLIALLRVNARESVASLARKLGVSRTTAQDRIRRLEESGAIEGYTVRLAEQVRRDAIRAFVTISVEPRKAVDVTMALKQYAAVESLHTVSGKYDLIAVVRTRSVEDMDRLLDQIGEVGGVTDTESAIVLSTKFRR